MAEFELIFIDLLSKSSKKVVKNRDGSTIDVITTTVGNDASAQCAISNDINSVPTLLTIMVCSVCSDALVTIILIYIPVLLW